MVPDNMPQNNEMVEKCKIYISKSKVYSFENSEL
jgi:hypothetical protein